MKAILISTLFLSTLTTFQAQAHIEPGTWMGKTDSQADCGFLVGAGYFEPNTPHPLHERIRVQMGNTVFTLQHPPVVDAASATAFFNHDQFQAINATSTGATAIVVKMEHTPTYEGPTEFTVIDHEWKSNKRTAVTCKNIRLKSKKKLQ